MGSQGTEQHSDKVTKVRESGVITVLTYDELSILLKTASGVRPIPSLLFDFVIIEIMYNVLEGL